MHSINLERYYNRFEDNPQYEDYKQLLFRAGDTLQSAELNELQTTLKKDIGRVANRFINNGDFLSGGEASIRKQDSGSVDANGDILFNWEISCNEGIFFADGEFLVVPEKTLTLPSTTINDANFEFGVMFHYSVVLEGEDSSLLDPAVGTRNYNQPGAGRLKILANWEFSTVGQDENNVFFPKYKVEKGEIILNKLSDDEFARKVTDIVAEYDREANGNYVVRGLETIYTTKDDYLGQFHFQISEGKANVGGYKFLYDTTTSFHLPNLIDFKLVQSEPVNFSVSGNYQLRHSPVRKVNRIQGNKNVVLNITHGTSGSSDIIPSEFAPVVRINSITQGGTTYVETTDFVLDNDKINWGPSGNEPSAGSSYTVDLDYVDVQLFGSFEGTNGDINASKDGINLEGYLPETVYIDYDFVLQRMDTIIINPEGDFRYVTGVAREVNPLPPSVNEENNLPIANIKLTGNNDPEVFIIGQRTFKMSDIEKLYDSIRDNEYNVNKLALTVDLTERGMALKNTFIDPFEDDNFRDAGYEGVSGYIPALIANGELTFEVDWETKDGYFGTPSSSLFPNPRMLRMGTVGSNSVKIQPLFTKVRKINEFLFTPAPRATLRISPSVYRWIDRRIFINLIREVESKNYLSNLVGKGRMYTWRGRYASWWDHHMRKSYYNTTVNKSSSVTFQRTPAIIPQITLTLDSKVQDFNSSEAVDIFWNGKLISTTSSDANGKIHANFQVPANEISGVKNVSVKGHTSGVEGNVRFTAQPLTLTVTRLTTRYWRWVRKGDPVAQSFSFDTTTVIDKVRVWFGKAPTTNTIFQIVELTAGFPDKNKMLTSLEIPAGQINDDSPFDFVLDEKITAVAGQSYAFIVGCDDAVGEVRTAKLGERTINTGAWVTSQTDSVGVFFNSSNNETWSAVQDEDMMFEIYSTTFENTKTISSNEISVTNVSDIILMTESQVSEGNSIDYSIELLDTYPVKTFNIDAVKQYRLGGAYTGRIKVKATMKSDGNYSPVLDPQFQLAVGQTNTTSTYTSVSFPFDPNDAKMVAYVDSLKESGTNFNIQAQIKSGNVWSWENMTSTSMKELGDNWKEETFELDLSSLTIDADQSITRIRIDLSSTSPDNKIFLSNLRVNNLKQ